jgi:hypothetical protein
MWVFANVTTGAEAWTHVAKTGDWIAVLIPVMGFGTGPSPSWCAKVVKLSG